SVPPHTLDRGLLLGGITELILKDRSLDLVQRRSTFGGPLGKTLQV
ncbi:unnamed protein product, partial [marine sediment metagenome]